MSFHLYADDTQLYTTFFFSNVNQLANTKHRTEACLTEVDLCMTCNKLKLNKEKTELLLLHSRYRLHVTLTSLSVGNDVIYPSSQARNIGVIFNDTLLSSHINSVWKSAYYHLRNIARIRKYLSRKSIEILIHAFVSSKLDYCNSLLYGLPKKDVQNTAARCCTSCNWL